MIFWTTGRVSLPSRSCELEKKCDSLMGDCEKKADRRLRTRIDVDVAGNLMMFCWRHQLMWALQLMDLD